MARRSVSKMNAWKVIGYVLAVILALAALVAAVTACATGIACLVNHVSFADQFKTWFPFFFKKETAEEVVEAARLLLHL